MKRNESEILEDILTCYVELSPENLYLDGEASHNEARRRASAIQNRLKSLFRELGRKVSEQEAYNFSKDF